MLASNTTPLVNLTQVAFESGGVRLSAGLHAADSPDAPAMVFCYPLFEERKSAYRTIVEAADALCREGISVLRFDYRGCGDSGGSFADFALADWKQDINAALAFVRQSLNPRCLGVLGLRAGAMLALRAGAQHPDVQCAILWEPVINGRNHVRQELRKKLTKEMVTFGQSRTTRDALLQSLENGEPIDFDGYSFSAGLYNDLLQTDIEKSDLPPHLRTFVVSMTPSGRPSPQTSKLVQHLSSGAQTGEIRGMALPPFWNLIGYVDATPLIAATTEWVKRTL